MITKAVREDNADTTVKCWHISYEVEDSGDKNSFVVVVTKEEFVTDTDGLDETEAKALANAKAATIKSDWVAAKASAETNTDVAAIEGSVTLS